MKTFANAAKDAAPSAVLTSEKTIKVVIEGAERSVTFNMLRMTPRLRQRFEASQKSKDANESEEAMVDFIARIVTAWDIPDPDSDEGDILPVSKYGAGGLSYESMIAVTKAISAPETDGPNATGASAESPD